MSTTPPALTSPTTGRVPLQEVFSDVDSGFGPSINGTYVASISSIFLVIPCSCSPARERGAWRRKDKLILPFAISDSNYATTIGSEVFSFVYENGRRYHSYREGIYMLPNDDREIERLDLYHHIFNVLLGGKLYVAPLGANIKRILDIGTGTGSWAIDMAE